MNKFYNEYYIEDGILNEINKLDESLTKEGKSLYEVIRIIDGKPLFLEKHLERFEISASLENLELWYTYYEIKKYIEELIKANKRKTGNIKIVFNFNDKNTFLCYFIKHSYPREEQYKEGVKTILYHGERQNPNAKVIDNNFRKKVQEDINENKVFEAILVDRNGYITEGSRSNIFMVKEGKVITAPVKAVLPGVTRNTIIDVCEKLNIEILEKNISYKNIDSLDGIFISGTSPKVLPICKVDSIKFDSANNTTIRNIMKAYNKKIELYIKRYI